MDSVVLLGGVTVVEVEGRDAFVVAAAFALPAPLGDEFGLEFPPSARYRFRDAPTATPGRVVLAPVVPRQPVSLALPYFSSAGRVRTCNLSINSRAHRHIVLRRKDMLREVGKEGFAPSSSALSEPRLHSLSYLPEPADSSPQSSPMTKFGPPAGKRRAGIEPATSTLARWRSTSLSYRRRCCISILSPPSGSNREPSDYETDALPY